MDIQVNFLSVLLAAIANLVVGFLWYSPLLFAKPWMKLMGYTTKNMKEQSKEMGKTYAISFVLAIVAAYVLFHVMAFSSNFYGYSATTTALLTGFWMWLGFVAPVQFTSELFGKKNWSLLAINTGYQLTALLVMGLIIAMF